MTDYSPSPETDAAVETVRSTFDEVCTEHRKDELDWPGDGHVFEFVASMDDYDVEIEADPRYLDEDIAPCCDIRVTVSGHAAAVYVITHPGTQSVYMGDTVRVLDALDGLLAKEWCRVRRGDADSWMYRKLTDGVYVEEDW